MTINFKNIPANIRVPLFFAEIDNSQANSGSLNQRTLIIGQITSSGVATPNVPILSQGVADAKTQGGQGSMLARMVAAYRGADSFGEVWLLPLADDGAAVAATGTVTVGGPATAAGVLSLYIAGALVSQAVTSGMTAAQLATALAATINANTDLPVTASAATAVVTLTAKNKGPAGNDIDIRVNYRGAQGGEVLPAGVTATIVAMASGATAPTLTTAFTNLGDEPFDFIVFPYTDSTSLDALKGLLDDITGRWSWSRQIYGHAFAAYKGTLGSATTLLTARNDQHVSIMPAYDSPTQPVIWAAVVAGMAATSLRADPGVPLHTLALPGVLAPPVASRFLLTDRNTLLFDGGSTFTVDDDGTVRIEGLVTTYQKNSFGQPDDSYLKVNTMFLLMFVLRSLKTRVTSKYARVKLAADGTRFGPGANVVTPKIIKADLIAAYREMEGAGMVQNGDAFKASVLVQKSTSNPNRVDVLWTGTLINQLDIFALLAQFRLS